MLTLIYTKRGALRSEVHTQVINGKTVGLEIPAFTPFTETQLFFSRRITNRFLMDLDTYVDNVMGRGRWTERDVRQFAVMKGATRDEILAMTLEEVRAFLLDLPEGLEDDRAPVARHVLQGTVDIKDRAPTQIPKVAALEGAGGDAAGEAVEEEKAPAAEPAADNGGLFDAVALRAALDNDKYHDVRKILKAGFEKVPQKKAELYEFAEIVLTD